MPPRFKQPILRKLAINAYNTTIARSAHYEKERDRFIREGPQLIENCIRDWAATMEQERQVLAADGFFD